MITKVYIFIAVLVVTLVGVTACADGEEETKDIKVVYDFGGGGGLCSINTTIDSTGVIYDRKRCQYDFDSYVREGKISDDELLNLYELIVDVMDMDERYLCHDTCDSWDCCPTDMPITQLTISIDGETKTIMFDYWNTPDELKEIAETIKGFRQNLGEFYGLGLE